MWSPQIRMFVGLMLLMPATAVAAPAIQLPRTGQTACWSANGTLLDNCSGAPGEDANILAGVELPPAPRFTEPSTPNGTLMDKVTDLVWLKNADCLNGTATWRQALDRAATLATGACGLSDNSVAGQWRVPNRNEMNSLVNFQQPDGSIYLNSQGFTGAASDYYWTSDTYVPVPTRKWVVHTVGDVVPDSITGTNQLRALYVRDATALAVTPQTVDFGTVTVAQPSNAQTITIANSSTGAVTVSGITVAGTDNAMFAVTPGSGTGACASLTPTIPPAGSCTVQAVFTPASAGAKTATLRVASNAEANPVVEAALTGTGTTTPGNSGNSATASSLADAVKAFQSVLGKTQLSDDEKRRFDVAPLGADGKPAPDGKVDVGDVVLLLRRMVGAVTW